MRFKYKTRSFESKYPKTKPWHWHFVIWPVTYEGTIYFLCWLPRRYVRQTIWFAPTYKAEYTHPEYSIAGSVLGESLGRKHGPNKLKKGFLSYFLKGFRP